MSEDQKNQVRQTFSKNSNAYVTSSTHSKKSDLDQITAWLQPDNSWTVLDIATGGGHVAKELSRSAGTVFATDLTIEMLQNTAIHLKRQNNIHYVVADAEELPFLDASFDAVTCRIAPHHFPEPDRFVKEVQRVLKPNGLFLMIDNVAPENDELDYFYNTFEKMRDASHCRALKTSEWEKLFRNQQLSIIKKELRQKTLPYREWLERTLTEEIEQDKVDLYFTNATDEAKKYFQFNNDLDSFTIEEWMVLCKKSE
ncbi:class I SAM-dependent methyltransferase [Halobacillus salinus]|uniref:class I SAM-dependent methyltransferase n=1 Tax=Halobacillus salinus TaxID=192814 RepID=UPI0009A66319|nr:methyltransferase domain-containing protein [Halobacillus salinus]